MAAQLDESPEYRVLRRFVPRVRYHEESWNLGDPSPVRLGAFVDVETTGLDRELDEVVEFSMVPFTYDAKAGVALEVLHGEAITGFDEPTREISDEVQAVHGITPAMVKGHRLDDAKITALVERCAIMIAHNADYDRPICERRLPVFSRVRWACSQQEVPWKTYGVVGAKLEHILEGACHEFYDAHRALDDCLVGIHCLAQPMVEGRTPLSHLLESARQPTVRVFAIDSPFPKKEAIKARRPRYKWSDGKSGMRKGWYVDLKPAAVDAEIEWLMVEIFSGRVEERHAIACERFSARDRYSLRNGQQLQFPLPQSGARV